MLALSRATGSSWHEVRLCFVSLDLQDLGYSDWFNVVASGDNMGLLQLASCWPVHKVRIKLVTKLRKGLVSHN